MGLIRLVAFGFLVLSVMYLAISWYSRSVRREKLEESWLQDHPGDTESEARAAYIRDGMIKYESGLRKKLILLVYVIPIVAALALLFIINAY